MPWLSSRGVFNEAMLEADTALLQQVFMEYGFVDVKVEPATTYLSKDKRFVYATIHVTEGVKYKLGKITIDGDFDESKGLTEEAVQRILEGTSAADVRLRYERAKRKAARGSDEENPPAAPGWDRRRSDLFNLDANKPVQSGDDYTLSTLQMVRQQISDLYGEEGYAFANVNPIPTTHPEDAVVDLNFNISKGERMWIGQIDITGNTPPSTRSSDARFPSTRGSSSRPPRFAKLRCVCSAPASSRRSRWRHQGH